MHAEFWLNILYIYIYFSKNKKIYKHKSIKHSKKLYLLMRCSYVPDVYLSPILTSE